MAAFAAGARTVPRRALGVVVCAVLLSLPAAGGRAAAVGCHSDSDCITNGGELFRCAQSPTPGQGLNCHIPGPGTKGNSTCVCTNPPCRPAQYTQDKPQKQYLMIGDSISIGMHSIVFANLSAAGIQSNHNPGNADNANLGQHYFDCWVPDSTAKPFDIISFQWGLHGLAYDTERISVVEYAAALMNITERLAAYQRAHGTKLIWVRTTPVPTVPTYDPTTCNDTRKCLNPPRFDSDVRAFNAAADQVMAGFNAHGAHISTLDLYTFVINKCGGEGYSSCPGFQLPFNVHYEPAGWQALASLMTKAVLDA